MRREIMSNRRTFNGMQRKSLTLIGIARTPNASSKRSPVYVCTLRSRARLSHQNRVCASPSNSIAIYAPLEWMCTNEKTAKNVDDDVVAKKRHTMEWGERTVRHISRAACLFYIHMFRFYYLSLRFYLYLTSSTERMREHVVIFFSPAAWAVLFIYDNSMDIIDHFCSNDDDRWIVHCGEEQSLAVFHWHEKTTVTHWECNEICNLSIFIFWMWYSKKFEH